MILILNLLSGHDPNRMLAVIDGADLAQTAADYLLSPTRRRVPKPSSCLGLI